MKTYILALVQWHFVLGVIFSEPAIEFVSIYKTAGIKGILLHFIENIPLNFIFIILVGFVCVVTDPAMVVI